MTPVTVRSADEPFAAMRGFARAGGVAVAFMLDDWSSLFRGPTSRPIGGGPLNLLRPTGLPFGYGPPSLIRNASIRPIVPASYRGSKPKPS
jgi:hypothetical protein